MYYRQHRLWHLHHKLHLRLKNNSKSNRYKKKHQKKRDQKKKEHQKKQLRKKGMVHRKEKKD
jgi:hypothetical protein